MTTPRVRVEARVRVDAYALVQRAVEEGLRFMVMRVEKHRKPFPEEVRQALLDHGEHEVMMALLDVLRFED